MDALNHERTSVVAVRTSALCAEADFSDAETDMLAVMPDIAGKADVGLLGRDVRS